MSLYPALPSLITAGILAGFLLLPYDRSLFSQLWPLTFLIYVPWPFRLLMAGWVSAMAVPRIRRECLTFLARLRLPPIWLSFLLSMPLFWLLRERTFYGDGLRKVGLLTLTEMTTNQYVWKEPLDTLLVLGTTRVFTGTGLGDAEVAIACLSILAGGVYMSTVFGLARLLMPDGRSRVLFVAGMFGLGSSQLWFGHVENYSLVTAATYVTVFLALAYRGGRVPLWGVGLMAGTAVSLHPQAAFTLPAFVLLLHKDRWWRQSVVLLLSGLMVPILTVGGLTAMGQPLPALRGGFAGDPQLFWRVGQALAPAQLVQALLNLWLLVPGLPVLLVAVLRLGRPIRDWTSRYLGLLVLGLLFYHFAFQNDLPRALDWDLYAVVGPGTMLFLLYRLLNHELGPSGESWILPVTMPIVAFSLAFTLAWIGVNHHYRLLFPEPDMRIFYARYQLLDLQYRLSNARITPPDPICEEPAGDPTGCRRVTPAVFTMPQDGDRREIIFAHAPAHLAFPLRLPREPTFLWTSVALDPLAWKWGGDGVTFQIWVAGHGEETLLWERHLSPTEDRDLDWQEVMVALDAYRGQEVDLWLVTSPGPDGDASGDRAGWGFPWIIRGTLDRRALQPTEWSERGR